MTELISRDELKRRIDAGEVTVVDALGGSYYEQQHLPGAIALTEDHVEEKAEEVCRNTMAAVKTGNKPKRRVMAGVNCICCCDAQSSRPGADGKPRGGRICVPNSVDANRRRILKGFRLKAQGCERSELPWVGGIKIFQPCRGCGGDATPLELNSLLVRYPG